MCLCAPPGTFGGCRGKVEAGPGHDHFGDALSQRPDPPLLPSPLTSKAMRTVTALLEPKRPERKDLEAFLDRQAALLQLEREEEEEQTRLLNSNCSAKLLEQRGLALNGLGVSSQNVGLGGKT